METLQATNQVDNDFYKNNETIQTEFYAVPQQRIFITRPETIVNNFPANVSDSELIKKHLGPLEDKTLCEKQCVILSVNNEDVEIELDYLKVLFPKSLFPIENLHLGQPFKYEIRINSDGYRYEFFEHIKTITPHEDEKDFLTLLSKIK